MMSSDDFTKGDGVSTTDENTKVRPLAYKNLNETHEINKVCSHLEYPLEDAQVEHTESVQKFLKNKQFIQK